MAAVLNHKFISAIRKSPKRQYELARAVGLHFTTLSHIIIGAIDPKPNDERVLKIADLIGFPREKVFEINPETRTPCGSGRAFEILKNGDDTNEPYTRDP